MPFHKHKLIRSMFLEACFLKVNGFILFCNNEIKWDFFEFLFNCNWIRWIPGAGRNLKFPHAPIYLFKSVRNFRNFFNHPLSILQAVTVSERLILDIDPLNSTAHIYWNGVSLLWCSLNSIWKYSVRIEALTNSRDTGVQNAKVPLDEESLAQMWRARGTRRIIFHLFLVSTSSWIISPSDNRKWDPIHLI